MASPSPETYQSHDDIDFHQPANATDETLAIPAQSATSIEERTRSLEYDDILGVCISLIELDAKLSPGVTEIRVVDRKRKDRLFRMETIDAGRQIYSQIKAELESGIKPPQAIYNAKHTYYSQMHNKA